MIDEKDLEPRVVSYGTTRTLRIRKIGSIYLVESMTQERDVVDGEVKVTDRWVVVAKADGKNASMEAHKFLHEANVEVRKLMEQNRQPRLHGSSAARSGRSLARWG